MPGIFVSYRREDTGGHAGRLAEQLAQRYGADRVFIDIDAIKPGVDFEDRIKETLSTARVTLVLIGQDWLEVSRVSGQRRIDAENDYVRKEIAQALAHPEGTVIPVLVERNDMPAPTELPPEIAALARRNAFRLSNERWRYDIQRLSERIDELTGSGLVARGRQRVRRPGALLAALAVLLAVVVGAVLLSTGGAGGGAGSTTVAPVRVDDIPVSNPTDQYHPNARGFDVQLNSTKPSIVLKIHNLGRQTSDVTEARFTVANALEVKPCFSAGGSPLSATYKTLLPLTPGAHIDTVINEQVKPDAIDEFRVVFDLPLSAYGQGALNAWFIRLHVQLLHDAATAPVDGGYVMLSFRGAPRQDNSLWWTAADVPTYAKLSASFGTSNVNCSIAQTPKVQRFLSLPGHRAQEVTDFAAQLTTRH